MSYKLNTLDKKIITLSSLGGMLEFYDFAIYGIFSVYFSPLFFPNSNPLLSVLESYAVFILGYLARPIGGIIFSHIGDAYGRKKVLVITIVLMGLSSLGIGLLPTYASIGVAAPILLLLLRLGQGLAVGGELPSTYVYINESIDTHKHGTAFGITMFGVNGGVLLAMIINQVLNFTVDKPMLESFGWRIPFVFGGLICIISYKIRQSLQETHCFDKVEHEQAPIIQLFKSYKYEMLIAILSAATMGAGVTLANLFMPTYLKDIIHIDPKKVSIYMTFALSANVVAIFITGQIANRVNHYKLMLSLLAIALFVVPCGYYLINYTRLPYIGVITLSAMQGCVAMLTPAIIVKLFPRKISLTGVAVSYNISFTLFSGLAPIVVTALIAEYNDAFNAPVLYLSVACLCGILAMFGIRKVRHNL